MGCGCGGSTQTQRPTTVTQKSPSTVPGGPGEAGYTWDGPQKTKTPARRGPAEAKKR